MSHQTEWVLGIDPGFGNTGAVLRLSRDKLPAKAACWYNDDTADWPVRRAQSICIPMIETVLAWVQENDITKLTVCMETPVYNGNAKGLMLQMILYAVIQAALYDYLVPILDEVYIIEVNNQTSKVALTGKGSAKKEDMIACSPWKDYVLRDMTYSQAHTLADALGHSLAEKGTRWALHKLPQYSVHANYVEE